MQLFSHEIIPLPLAPGHSGQLGFWPNWLDEERASACLRNGKASIPWQSDNIAIAGKSFPIPRLHCWFSEGASTYAWSGIKMTAHPFPAWLDTLRLELQEITQCDFNSCLANYYRSGQDSVDWHADDEAVLGTAPIIASISLGDERTFQLRHRESRKRFNLKLPHGSLLLMGPGVQQYWQHRIPKVKNCSNPRLNFTFRNILGLQRSTGH